MPSTINADNGVSSGSAGLKSTADSSGVLALQTNGTTAISIDASQAVSFTNQPTYSGGTANGVAYLNGSKVLTTGSALTYDGTNLTVNTGTVSATYGKLTVAGGISITPDSSSKFQIGRYSAGAPYSYIKMGSTSSGLKFTDPADSVDLMTLDASGRLGIGQTSPFAPLVVAGADFNAYFTRTTSSSSEGVAIGGSSGIGRITSNGAIPLTLEINGNEKARIDSSGNLLVGTTDSSPSAGNGVKLQKNRSGLSEYNAVSVVSNANNAGYSSYELYTSTGTTGYKFYVLYNGGISNFSANNVNLSDRREKTDFEPAGNYLAKICAIPVQTFNYINQGEDDQGKTLGVVAQDVQAVAPELVTETKLGTDGEGETRLAIYQTDLQYALMKCIQEMKAIIDTQASTITQLQADVAALKGA